MKRKFEDIRARILNSVAKKPMSKMEISRAIKADYRTIERHLIWLLGMREIKVIKKGGKLYYKKV